jgi:microcompartment protein CcmL/EutN
MQANIAIGLLELSSIAKGIETADAMRKTAEIKIEYTAVIARGKYIIIISGSTAEVESSISRGIEIAGKELIDKYIIRNVHKGVIETLNKKNKIEKIEAIGVIETKDAISIIFAADAALKAAYVNPVELKSGAGGGKGYFIINGEVGAVKTAVSAAIKAISENAIVSRIVIPNAHEDMIKVI